MCMKADCLLNPIMQYFSKNTNFNSYFFSAELFPYKTTLNGDNSKTYQNSPFAV